MLQNQCNVYVLRIKEYGFINYCYVIYNKVTKQAAIIDPAWNFQCFQEVLNQAQAECKMVLLTHSHIDHTNLAHKFAEIYNADIYMNEDEVKYYHFNCNRLNTIKDGQLLWLGDQSIKCIQTPGHTVGSTCYWINNYLFTGDTIFTEGCGICCTEGGSPEDMYHSIQNIKNTIPENTIIYPGHSYKVEVGQTLKYLNENNIYFQFSSISMFTKFRMRKNGPSIFDFH